MSVLALAGCLGGVYALGESAPATQGAASATTAPAVAAVAESSPLPGSRVLKTFDFEEMALHNFEATPMYWSRVVGHGYPSFTSAKFVKDVHRSGETAFELQIDGGSVAYQYAPGRIAVNPNADYYVIGFVKTTPMAYARAEITGWFADEQGKLLPSTETHSDRYAAPVGGKADGGGAAGDWHVLHVFMPGQSVPNAKSLVLQMGLYQPRQLSNGVLGRFELYQQDIKGAAWFDDLVVFQLPRLSVAAAAGVAGNIFGPRKNIELDLTVADLGREKLSAGLTIADAAGKAVLGQRWDVQADPKTPWTQHYTHEPLGPGVYTATLDVFERNVLIARRQMRFACLAEAGLSDRPAPEFGVVATSWPVDAWGELPAILKHTGAGFVQLPAWRKDMSDDAVFRRDVPFETLVGSLERMGFRTLATFADVPTILSEKLDEKRVFAGDPLLALVDADASVWRPYLSFPLARNANHVELWQIGAHPDASACVNGAGTTRFAVGDARYGKLYGKSYAELSALISNPQMVIPWDALYDFDATVFPHAILNLKLSSGIKPSQIPTYIASFGAEAGGATEAGGAATAPATTGGIQNSEFRIQNSNVIALIEPLSERGYARTDRMADFAQRVVYARSANPRMVLVDLPMARRAMMGNPGSTAEPDELFVVYRTLAKALGGAAFKRELPLAPGIKAFLFDRGGAGIGKVSTGGTMVIWNESAESSTVPLEMPLGAAPRVGDLMGNVQTLAVDAAGLVRFNVTAMPLIVDQLDSRMAELRCSFGLGAASIPAGVGSISTEVLLTNPYAEVLSGTLRLTPPKGWSIDPPSIAVSLASGAKLRQPVTIRYPYTESTGSKVIRATLSFDGAAQPLDMMTMVTLHSETVETEVFAQIVPDADGGGGGELVLQQMITNVSAEPLNAQAYALVPGFARQQRFVLELQPRATVIKRFTFPLAQYASRKGPLTAAEALERLHGRSATLGLRQNDGKTLITKSVPIE